MAKAKNSPAFRMLRDACTGDIYLWNAEDALHEEVVRQLALGDNVENLGQVYTWADYKKKSRQRR